MIAGVWFNNYLLHSILNSIWDRQTFVQTFFRNMCFECTKLIGNTQVNKSNYKNAILINIKDWQAAEH